MKPFDKITYVGGSKHDRKPYHGRFIAEIPPELRKNKQYVVILDHDLNVKRVDRVYPAVPKTPIARKHRVAIEELHKQNLEHGSVILDQIAFELLTEAIKPKPFKNGDKVRVRDLKSQDWVNNATYIGTHGGAHAVMTAHGQLHLLTYCELQPVAEPKKPYSPSNHFDGATKFVVKQDYCLWKKGDILKHEPHKHDEEHKWLMKCKKRNISGWITPDLIRPHTLGDVVLPPSAHFDGATKFLIKHDYGLWRKGDIVEHVPSDSDEPLKWQMKRLLPIEIGRRPLVRFVRFNNLFPLPKDF